MRQNQLRKKWHPKNKKDDEVQGVFVIRNKKAIFVPVNTGITGTTDIEVLEGLKEADEVITGSYKVLRTLRPGSSVKIDNKAPKKRRNRHNLSGNDASKGQSLTSRVQREHKKWEPRSQNRSLKQKS